MHRTRKTTPGQLCADQKITTIDGMDIISHGLWGSFVFGRRNRRSFLLAFFLGVAPDLFSFGTFFVASLLGGTDRPSFAAGPPPAHLIPGYVYALYSVTHSAIIFSVAFITLWVLRRHPVWEMAAWGLHILYDIPFHEHRLFPTPFLWPISSYTFDGWAWSDPWIFFPNVVALAVLSIWFFMRTRHVTHTG